QKKIEEFAEIARDVDTQLGKTDELAPLLKEIAEQYIDVVELILNRGSPKFHHYSRKLYGSPKDTFFGDKNRIGDLGQLLYSILSKIDDSAMGNEVPEDVEAARSIMRDAQRREIRLLVPADTNQGFDIGPKTIEKFSEVLSQAGTIFWNGPLGWFEKPEYSDGTFKVARAVAETSAIKIVGGGDTVSAIKKSGFSEKFDHLSTGGGAVLEYLEGNGLPGIDVLKLNNRQLYQLQMQYQTPTDDYS
ncbi:phosphoglycerate kinase, partial [bacterium]|nr:phosphoglycerate kinase [bacterium]